MDGNDLEKVTAKTWALQFVAKANGQCGPPMVKTAHALSDKRDENASEGNSALVDITKAEIIRRMKEIKRRADPDNILCHNRKLASP